MFTTVWTEETLTYVLEHYRNTPNHILVAETGISERTIQRKMRSMGITKDADYLHESAMNGIREMQYLHVTGQIKAGPPKGLRCNPAGEFKKGHRESLFTRARRIAALRSTSDMERTRIAKGLPQKTKWKMKTD